MKKKIILIILILIISFGAFFLNTHKSAQLKNENQNEVVFWTLQMNDFAPYMKEVISEFEHENPDIKIIQHWGGGSGLLENEINAALDNNKEGNFNIVDNPFN